MFIGSRTGSYRIVVVTSFYLYLNLHIERNIEQQQIETKAFVHIQTYL